MKHPVTIFNNWLLSKITVYLSNKEGCIVEEQEYTFSGIKAIVRDAFGYRYEIHVKTLSRLTDHLQDSDETSIIKKSINVDILEDSNSKIS
jgi:hypothetical protein